MANESLYFHFSWGKDYSDFLNLGGILCSEMDLSRSAVEKGPARIDTWCVTSGHLGLVPRSEYLPVHKWTSTLVLLAIPNVPRPSCTVHAATAWHLV